LAHETRQAAQQAVHYLLGGFVDWKEYDMKSLIIAVCFGMLSFVGEHSVHGEEARLLLYQTDMDWGGGTNQWWLPYNRLQQLPKWNPEKAEPPVSQMKALKIAMKWLTSKGVSGSYNVDYILLRAVRPDDNRYRFDFHYRIVFGNVNAYLNHMTCIVLMDGTVLEPELYGHATKDAPPANLKP
jgi:hypothetical protein